MSDISNQLIKDSYDYVLQSDLGTGVVYRIGGAIPVNPIFQLGLTVNDSFTYSNGTEGVGYALLTDGTGYAYWGPISAATPSSGVTSVTGIDGIAVSPTTGNVVVSFTGTSDLANYFLPLSGGTVTGLTVFNSGVDVNSLTAFTSIFDNITVNTQADLHGLDVQDAAYFHDTVTMYTDLNVDGTIKAGTISATTYLNYPDSYVTGFSLNNDIITLSQNRTDQYSAFTISLSAYTGGSVSGEYLPLSGGTVYGNTYFTSGLSANTLFVSGLTRTSGLTSTGGITFPQKTVSSTYTVTDSDYMVDVTGGTFNVQLPTAIGVQGRLLAIKNNGGGAVTILPFGSEKIDDKTLLILSETNAAQLVSNGAQWVILGQDRSTVNNSTGVFEFSGLSKVSSTQFSVARVRGWIVDDTSNPLSPQIYYVDYSGGTHTDNYVNTSFETFVYLTSGGTISQKSIPLTEQERRQNIFLGKIGHPDKTTINLVFSQPDFVLSPLSQLRDMFVPINLINGGVYPSVNGPNLNFNTSAGYLYGLGINFSLNTLAPNTIFVPGQSPCTFQYRTQTGGSITNVTTIDPTKWDVNGVVTNLTGTKATNQRVYLLQNGTIRVQYGQTQYNQLSAAIAGIQSETFVTFPNFTNNAILIGILSVISTCTDLSDTTKAQFFLVSKFGEAVGAAGGIGTTTLQQAYNNSSEPEITINSTLDGLSIKNGTGSGDTVAQLIQGVNSGNLVTSFIRADGAISGTTFFGNGGNLTNVFHSVNINGTPQFSANTNTFINFSGINLNIISGANNTLIFSAGTGGSSGSSGFDVYVTGGTYNGSQILFTNNSGGTFTVTGLTASGLSANYYGSFSDSTNQPVSGANIATVWKYNTTEISNGISVVDNTKITVQNAGVYEIGYSPQIEKTQGTNANVTIWAAINGNPVSRSSSTFGMVSNSVLQLPFVSFIFELNAGDYVEFYFSSDNQYVQLTTLSGLTTPTRPDSPSVIIVAKQVGLSTSIGGSGDTFVTGFTLSDNTITLSQNRRDQYSAFTISLSAYTGSSFVQGITGITGTSGVSASTTDYVTTIINTDKGSSQNIFKNIQINGNTQFIAGSNNDTINFSGIGLSITSGLSNTLIFSATPGGVTSILTNPTDGISASSTTGAITLINTRPQGITGITGTSGVSASTTDYLTTIINTNPDRTVVITGGTNIEIISDYPNFGINFTGKTFGDYLPLSGGTVTGFTSFQSGLTSNSITATIISATTYYNVPNYNAGVIVNSNLWINNNDGTMTFPTTQVALYSNTAFTGSVEVYTVTSATTGSGGLPALSNNDTNYIVINYNGGSPVYDVLTDNSTINNSNIVLYLIVYRANNFVHVLDFGNEGAGLPNKLNDRVIATDRFARENGFSLALSGSTGVVTLSGGIAWNATNRQSLVAVNSQDDVFFQNYHSGSTWVYTTTSNTLNNLYYDTSTDKVLATAGKYLVNWYFRGQEVNDHLYEVWSTDEYDSVSEAQLSTEPNLPELITSHAFLTGRIIVQVSATTGIVESAFVQVFQPTTVQSHNDLTGIQGGSAGQYYHLTSSEYTNVAYKNVNNIFSVGQLFNDGITATTISATTYQNLPVSAVTNGDGISASTSGGVVTITNTRPQGITGITATDGLSGDTTNFLTTIINTDKGSSQNIFKNIQIGGITQFSATSNNSTLNFSGVNISIISASTNTLVFSAGTGGGGGLAYYISGSTPSGTINSGDRWFDTNAGLELVYINDGDSSQWIQPNSLSGSFTGNTAANCISQLYVTNVYGCSPINFNDPVNLKSGATFSETTTFNGPVNINSGFTSNLIISTAATINGNLTVTGNTSLRGLTATTISATTYQNLPIKYYAEFSASPTNSPIVLSTGSISIGDGAQARDTYMLSFGQNSGRNATGTTYSNFIGVNAGYDASGSSYSNFIGSGAGYGAINTSQSIFIGASSGFFSTGVTQSFFVGNESGRQSVNLNYSNVFGYQAGYGVTNATYVNFLGNQAGYQATSAQFSNFIGYAAGTSATNAQFSNFIGYSAGLQASSASYSTLIGFNAGKYFIGNNIGSNNIIIGTNISLPSGTTNSLNIGGVLFGTGLYSTTGGDPSITGVGGKIGINVVNPTSTLDIGGDLRVTGVTSSGSFTGTSDTISGTKGSVISNGSTTTAFITVSGSNTIGGTDYNDFIRATNTAAGATNPTKTIRVNITGGIEFLNNAYTAQILTLTDGGVLSVGGGNTAVTSNNDPSANYLSFNNNFTAIYDDGNTHIHSRSNGGSMWINTNNGAIILGNQIPVLGGGAASGIIMGSGSTTIRAFANIYGGKTYTIGSYGYLATIGAGTGAGTTATYGLYVQQRVEASEFDATSDERLKNIQGGIELDDAIKLVNNVKPIKFTWKDKESEGIKVGYSAQQVVKSGFNHLIGHIKNEDLIEMTDNEGFTSPKGFQLTMNYDQVTPYHGVVIKHLLEEIKNLKEEINELKNKVG